MTEQDSDNGLPRSTTPPRIRRLVIFVGPHKSASSSVQEFFFKYASSRQQQQQQQRLTPLQNWTWPWNPKRKMYHGRKAFAVLVTERDNTAEYEYYIPPVYNSIRQVLQREQHQNLILGTEEFDRFGSTPWSNRDGIQAIHEVIDFILKELSISQQQQQQQQQQPQELHIDFVVNYRRPRKDQWISIWKQLTRNERSNNNNEYKDFLCQKLQQRENNKNSNYKYGNI